MTRTNFLTKYHYSDLNHNFFGIEIKTKIWDIYADQKMVLTKKRKKSMKWKLKQLHTWAFNGASQVLYFFLYSKGI